MTRKGLTIRTAVASEREALEALQLRASLTNTEDRDAVLAHPDCIAIPPEQIADGQVFVAETDGSIAGFAAVLPREDGQIELDGLFVEPHLQRRGYGRALVAHCAEFALARGASTLHVVGNRHAETFYAACGFTYTGTQKTRFGEGLLLRKDLRATAPPSR